MYRNLFHITSLFLVASFTSFKMGSSEYLLPGVRHPAYISDELIHELADEALNAFHKQMSPDNVYKILRIKSITSQASPGPLYMMTMEVGITGCKLSEVEIESRRDCDLLLGEENVWCKFSILERPWEKVKRSVTIKQCAYSNEDQE